MNTPWQTCTHPLSERVTLQPLLADEDAPEGSGHVYQQYDCLCCGSMKTEYQDSSGKVLQDFGWEPPEDGDGVVQ